MIIYQVLPPPQFPNITGHIPELTLGFHPDSIPGTQLSSALSGIMIPLPLPSTNTPPKFIHSTTVHILSQSATFELSNPLSNSPILLSSLYANATYNDDIIAVIFEPNLNEIISPGVSAIDQVPLELGDVGMEVIKKAMGGELLVDTVSVGALSIGKWTGRIRYQGNGVGADIRL